MMDHVEQMKDGIEKIKEGFSQLNTGPASYTLDCLLAAYHTLLTQYVPFKTGARVELREVPASAVKEKSGWWHCRHFLIPGNGATVQHVSCGSDGFVRYDIVFDRETWIDREGKEQPILTKHVFSLFEKELIGYKEIVR
jgi:hypothetical protein